jgi:meso-butanediol dehydrogenase/(S,S)-butanediol dehydrogenase/diacetyl reductase
MRLQNRTAVITGGGSGIGRATGELFGREGAKVVVADFREDMGSAAVEAIEKAGAEALFIKTDVSDPLQVDAAIRKTCERFGPPDILVNCAGVLLFGTVVDTDPEAWNRLISVNLTGTFLFCRAVIPYMRERGGGVVVNISSSTGAHDAAANTAAYVASKGGITLLTKAMAIDHAKEGIRVNAIAPGPTDTQMLRDNLSVEQLKAFMATFPIGRLGNPVEQAAAILFLVSEEASFVTGAILAVDGGQTAEV